MTSPKHSLSTGAVALDAEQNILLVKRSRRGWEFPGGIIELGGTIEDGIIREVKEEAGIDIASPFNQSSILYRLPTPDVHKTIHSLIEVTARLDDDPVHRKLESALVIVSQKRRHHSGSLLRLVPVNIAWRDRLVPQFES